MELRLEPPSASLGHDPEPYLQVVGKTGAKDIETASVQITEIASECNDEATPFRFSFWRSRTTDSTCKDFFTRLYS